MLALVIVGNLGPVVDGPRHSVKALLGHGHRTQAEGPTHRFGIEERAESSRSARRDETLKPIDQRGSRTAQLRSDDLERVRVERKSLLETIDDGPVEVIQGGVTYGGCMGHHAAALGSASMAPVCL